MKAGKFQIYSLIIICIFFAGCFTKSPAVSKADKKEEIKWAENIALLPLENKTKDEIALNYCAIKYWKNYISKAILKSLWR